MSTPGPDYTYEEEQEPDVMDVGGRGTIEDVSSGLGSLTPLWPVVGVGITVAVLVTLK